MTPLQFEQRLVIQHGNLRLEFLSDSTYVYFQSLPEERGPIVSASIGADAVECLLSYAYSWCKTTVELDAVKNDINGFVSAYYLDKDQLSRFAIALRSLMETK